MMTPMRRYSRIEGILLLASAFALIPMLATDAAGLQVDVVPSARIEEGWESNVFDTSTGEVSSFATRVTPRLTLKFTSTDNVEMRFSGNYERVWYHDAEAKPSNSDTFHFRVESDGEFRLTPTFSMVPSVSYINTTSASRRTQLVPSGDPVLPPVSITNYGNTDTEDIAGGLRLNYQATQNVTIGVGGNYGRRRFDSTVDNAALAGLTDSSTFGAAASVSYLLSPRSKLGVRLAGSRQSYEDKADTKTLSGRIIFMYLFSPTVQLDGGLGVQHIRSSEEQGSPAESASAPSGTLNLSYKQKSFTVTVFGSSVYSGGSGFGEATREFTAGMRLMDRFARDWTWNLSGTYQVSRSVFETDSVNLHTINGATGFQYQPWRWATLDLAGNVSRQRSSGQFGEDLNNYSAHLGFTAAYPFNLY